MKKAKRVSKLPILMVVRDHAKREMHRFGINFKSQGKPIQLWHRQERPGLESTNYAYPNRAQIRKLRAWCDAALAEGKGRNENLEI